MVPGSALRPARPATPPGRGAGPVPVTSHGLSLRLERGCGVSAGLLHFPAGNAARWRHQAHRIIEAGPGASSSAAARWPAPGARASRARTRVVVSGKRPEPKLRGSLPAGGIATPAAQQASAKCGNAADTPAAASRRRIVTRRRTARRGPARRSGARRSVRGREKAWPLTRSEPPGHIVPRRTARDLSRRHQCPQPHRPSCLVTSSSRTGLPAPALIAASSLARAGRELGRLYNRAFPDTGQLKEENVTGNRCQRPVRPKRS